jgi:hypothetical protein
MPRGHLSLSAPVLTLAVAALALAGAPAPADGQRAKRALRMNELQVIGTHNSYHRELSKTERAAHDAVYGGAPIYDGFLAYSHASLPNQFSRQGVRGVELDLFPDPAGGLYANPLLRQRLMAGPLTDAEWYRPRIKVLHTADLDYNSTCVRLVSCVRLVRRWSRSNPDHVPLLVMLELKGTDPVAAANGGVSVPPWDRSALNALDAEIRSVFRPEDLITPDDVRRRGLTLRQSVRRRGWPTLRRARGRVALLMDNEPGAIRFAGPGGRASRAACCSRTPGPVPPTPPSSSATSPPAPTSGGSSGWCEPATWCAHAPTFRSERSPRATGPSSGRPWRAGRSWSRPTSPR